MNTCGWIDGAGFEIIIHAIAAFDADMVLVIDNDRLYADLQVSLRNRTNTTVIKLTKSGGVVARSRVHRRNARAAKIKEYFYGPTNGESQKGDQSNLLNLIAFVVSLELSPHSMTIDLKDIVILKVGGDGPVPSSALPIGATSSVDELSLVPVTISLEINHSILGVSHAQTQDQILESNVAGFLYV